MSNKMKEGEMNQTANEHQGDRKQDRLLPTLERLLSIEATELDVALNEAALLVADALGAEKVDVFLHDPTVDTLIALGTSDTPLGRRQRALGLDRMPVVNGGYIVKVFLSGISYLTGHLEQEPDRVIGMTSTEGLGVRSEMVAGLEVNGTRRGVLMASCRTPDFFSEQDMHFLEAVSRWIGIVIQRTELVERLKKEAVQHNRRMLAEELLTVAAHNVRNYLTPLNVHVDLIQMRAQHRKRMQDIHDTTVVKNLLHRLERLIDDLLDVARLDQGLFFLNEQPVKLARLVQETAL
ncbi:MAG TPA: GAF domain-containing protein, partial [Ktedonobacteraceae bacterium]|nr:GAF domain-containing protein [Ktedonobacteraceae bacterium]